MRVLEIESCVSVTLSLIPSLRTPSTYISFFFPSSLFTWSLPFFMSSLFMAPFCVFLYLCMSFFSFHQLDHGFSCSFVLRGPFSPPFNEHSLSHFCSSLFFHPPSLSYSKSCSLCLSVLSSNLSSPSLCLSPPPSLSPLPPPLSASLSFLLLGFLLTY